MTPLERLKARLGDRVDDLSAEDIADMLTTPDYTELDKKRGPGVRIGFHWLRYGERVEVSHERADGMEGGEPRFRGWLELADDEGVTIRLPSHTDPEKPGDNLVTVKYPLSEPRNIMVTCVPLYEIRGLWISYLDPGVMDADDWMSTGECTPEQAADSARYGEIVRAKSLATPLADVHMKGHHIDRDAWIAVYGSDPYPDEAEDE